MGYLCFVLTPSLLSLWRAHLISPSPLQITCLASRSNPCLACVICKLKDENEPLKLHSSDAHVLISVLPSFTKTPMDLTIRAGAMARLECAALGHPAPQIAWQKDGGTDFPAARERRMHVMPEDDVFFIVDVKIEDIGVYSCTAQNSAGSISANATLTVLGKWVLKQILWYKLGLTILAHPKALRVHVVKVRNDLQTLSFPGENKWLLKSIEMGVQYVSKSVANVMSVLPSFKERESKCSNAFPSTGITFPYSSWWSVSTTCLNT